MVYAISGEETSAPDHFQAKRERLEWLKGLLPKSQGQNLALTVLNVPYSLDSGTRIPHS